MHLPVLIAVGLAACSAYNGAKLNGDGTAEDKFTYAFAALIFGVAAVITIVGFLLFL